MFSNMTRLSQLALSGNRLKVVDGSVFAHMPGKTPNLPVVLFLSKDGRDCVGVFFGIYLRRAEEIASS